MRIRRVGWRSRTCRTTWTWTLGDDTDVYLDEDGSTSGIEDGDMVMVHGTRDGDARQAEAVTDPPPDLGELRERIREALPDKLRQLPDKLREFRIPGCGRAA